MYTTLLHNNGWTSLKAEGWAFEAREHHQTQNRKAQTCLSVQNVK